MNTITVSVTKIPPKFLFLIRWAVKLAGANIVVCRRKVKHDPPNSAVNYEYDPSVSSSTGPHSVGHP